MQYRFVFILLVLTSLAAWSADKITLSVGGEDVYLHTSPVLIDGKVYAPLPALNALGARYDTDTNRKKDGQVVRVTNAAGREISCQAHLVENELMVPIQQMAADLGAKADWNDQTRTLAFRARVEKIEFDGSDLKVTTSYPVLYDVVWWGDAKKLIIDVFGAVIPNNLPTDNQTDVPIRTGMQTDNQTGRIVLDMPCIIKKSVKSSAKSSMIYVVVSGLQKPAGPLEPSAPPSQPAIQPPPPVIPAPPAEITDINYKEQGTRRMDVVLSTSGPVKYRTSMLRDPDRLIIDLSNATLSREFADISVKNRMLQSIHAEQAMDSKVRLTMNLTRIVGFDINQSDDGSKMVISLALPKGAGGPMAGKTVVIDPGHGGPDAGAQGCGGCYEKDSNLELALCLQKALMDAGVVALVTRKTDVALDQNKKANLEKRADFAARHSADLFISIHGNSISGPRAPSGIMSFYHGHDMSGNALANCVHSEVVAAWGVPDLLCRSDYTLYQTGLGVLRRASESYGIPAILVELGYVINPDDLAKRCDPAWQRKAADAIVRGIRAYFEGSPPPSKHVMPPDEIETTQPEPIHQPFTETTPEVKPEPKTVTRPEVKPPPASNSSGPPRPGERS